MCGFSGLISDKNILSSSIENSLASIKHRGVDNTLITNTSSFYASNLSNAATKNIFPNCEAVNSNIWLGFNRLSFVDFSENGMQPFYDKNSDCFFMLNGEIYNYKALKKDLLADTNFSSDSDSEVAFKLYLKYGDAFINYLQGMFAIVIFHKKDLKLKIWRDRLGIKPFYYYHDSHNFIFSSEVKGILSSGLVTKKPNFQGIAYSMFLGTCPAPLTIYDNIFSLQAGHKLEFSFKEQSIKIESYWNLSYSPSSNIINYDEFAADVIQLCKLYDSASSEKAIMLSGGIDSGTLAYFYGLVNNNLKAFTIFQKDSANNELVFAIDNAANAGLDIQDFEIPASPNKQVKEYYLNSEEEPNFIPEPTVFLAKKASELNVKILYNALGLDEIFGGYGYFQKIKHLQNFEWFLPLIPSFILPSQKRQKLMDLKKYGIQYLPFISRNKFTWDEINAFLSNNKQPIPEHPIAFINKQILILFPDFVNLPKLKQASYLDIFYYISSHHTFRSDVPSMLHSIEMRFPFLDHTFIQKYFNQSDTFVNIHKELKPQMRLFAKNYLSSKVLNMQKKGFSIDASKWIGGDVSQKSWYKLGLDNIFDDLIL